MSDEDEQAMERIMYDSEKFEMEEKLSKALTQVENLLDKNRAAAEELTKSSSLVADLKVFS